MPTAGGTDAAGVECAGKTAQASHSGPLQRLDDRQHVRCKDIGIAREHSRKRFVEEGAFVFVFERWQVALWAEDLKGTSIRVNVLSPGATATELATEALGEDGLKAYGAMTALQRMGDPAEIAAAAAFLASDDSSFMTASEVAVDGGLAQL